ncbi:cyclin-D1-binding protein 1 homolog, partial [Ruditapes philippinarum]|uniref:cyclin-D1-binding protein 1 homolog n=1 Tax=Ruditapes philippinarum TaxID=129788 RepID=UPI00295B828C
GVLPLLENLTSVIDQIQDGEGKSTVPDDFNYKAYWKKLGDVFKAVSHEATKLSLAYSKPPVPSNEECESLLASVEKTILALLHVYSNLPKCAGLTLRKTIKLSVRQLVEGIKTLAETIQKYSAGSNEQLHQTGIVWEESDRFSKLPQDNRSAVLIVIENNIPMVDDAHSELTEALNNDEDDDGLDQFLGISDSRSQNDQQWSEMDKNVIQYCLGLIKCSKSLLKKTKSAVKTNGNCESDECISQLDDVADRVERLSPVVDDLASCVYPPLNGSVVHEKALELGRVNRELLDFLRHSHVTGEDDKKWLDFLVKANSHNLTKLTSLMPPS